VTVQAALMTGADMLRKAGIDDPARDARKLMAAALGLEPARLTLHLHDDLAEGAEAAYLAHITERCAGRPVSQLLGSREFYGRRFEVNSHVLDPRPETETLIEAALRAPFGTVLDLGTGSGCILLTLLAERPGATAVGSDLSPAALEVARRNARALAVEDRCRLIESDWFQGLEGRFDLIVSNPPYIASAEMAGLAAELCHEPRMALTDEADGLSAYRVIAAQAGAHLVPGGRLLVETGWQQGQAVAALLKASGFEDVAVLPDLDGRDRVVAGHWSAAEKP
jgi:release factor glutamine methyltransferase